MEKSLLKKFDEGLSLGRRIADALEKLVNEPLIEIMPAPPQCPHCGKVNPTIQLEGSTNARGPMNEYLLEATCIACGRPIYALAKDWQVAGSKSEMIAIAEQMRYGSEVAQNGRSGNS